MECTTCLSHTRKFGKTRNGTQRYRCDECRKTFIDETNQAADGRKLAHDKAILALRMLLEGNSVRSTERLLEIHRDTILKYMVRIGENCEQFLMNAMQDIPCNDVEIDEIWSFVQKKERIKRLQNIIRNDVGDVYCFTALERHTKLILAWRLGPRDRDTAKRFIRDMHDAVQEGPCQFTTDGFVAYPLVMSPYFANSEASYAVLNKRYGKQPDDHKYSPPRVIGIEKVHLLGNPNPDMICTSHVERHNLTLRMQIRRLTRLTNAFSKKLRNHKAALALFFAYYNYCRVHTTLKTTPAVAAGLTDHVWTVAELLKRVASV